MLFLDLETFYDVDYTLRTLSIPEYVGDERFALLMVGVARETGPTTIIEGTLEEVRRQLLEYEPDWGQQVVVCHNAMFDGYVLVHKLGIRPRQFMCTMMLSRVHVVPFSKSMSLAKVSTYLGLGKKGSEIVMAKGMHREAFTDTTWGVFQNYCRNDVALCRDIWYRISPEIGDDDKVMCSATIRKGIYPQLLADEFVLGNIYYNEKAHREKLLAAAGITDPKYLRSNKRFAFLLERHYVRVPMKISPTTGKETYAFAKTDKEFVAMLKHPDPTVRALVEARMGLKTSLMSTRCKRLLNVSKSMAGMITWPLLFFGAHTGRMSGYDKMNMQNLPARENVTLRAALTAPMDKVVVAADLSQIEGRLTALLAMQNDMLEAYRNGEDQYKQFAGKLYDKPAQDITSSERFVGKTALLGLQYQCGALRFLDMLHNAKVDADEDFAREVVSTYRCVYNNISSVWSLCREIVSYMANPANTTPRFFRFGYASAGKFTLFGNRVLYYPDLRHYEDEDEDGKIERFYAYTNNVGNSTKLFGGKLLENVVQAYAQLVIRDAELRMILKGYHACGQVHDELVYVVDESELKQFTSLLTEAMTTPPAWQREWIEKHGGAGIPLACEVSWGRTYADCK